MRVESRDERRGFSALDALWILSIVLALVLLFVCILPTGGEKRDACEVRYVLRVRDVDPALLGEDPETLISAGVTVRSENGTAVLGSVESVTVREQMRTAVRDGRLVFIAEEDAVILEVTVRGEGIARTGDGVRISDVRIAAGGVGSFRLGGFYAARASVTHVERIDGEERE